MATIPSVTDWLVGEDITDVRLNEIHDYLRWGFETRPFLHLVQQSAQTGWTTATDTAVTFGSGSEVIDNTSDHSTSSNTSRVLIGNTLGWYQVSGVYAAPSNTNTTTLRASIGLNGAVYDGSKTSQQLTMFSGTPSTATGTVLIEATSASDYVELLGYQTASAGTLGTGVTADIASSLTVIYIGKP